MQAVDNVLASNGLNVADLARRFGLNPDQAQSAMGSLVPAVLGGFHKQAEAGDPAGVAAAANSIAEPDTGAGNDILGRIFGNKDVSRQVADHASAQTGVSGTVLKAMLPVVAAMVAKHVASGNGAGGLLGGMLGSVLGGGGSLAGGAGGPGSMFGSGANPLDDILGRVRG